MIQRYLALFGILLFFIPACATPLLNKKAPSQQTAMVEEEETPLEIGEEGKKPALEIDEENSEKASSEVTFDIPIVINDQVERFIQYFQTTHRKAFALWLQRSGRYIPMMKEVLKQHGLSGLD
jgi:membrane-bound lytic murein transglycosylase D